MAERWPTPKPQNGCSGGRFQHNTQSNAASQYWDGWTEFNMGITWWSHRPLAPMMLSLALPELRRNPCPGTNPFWLDDEFETWYTSQRNLDLEERRHSWPDREIPKDRVPSAPLFMNVWTISSKKYLASAFPEEFSFPSGLERPA